MMWRNVKEHIIAHQTLRLLAIAPCSNVWNVYDPCIYLYIVLLMAQPAYAQSAYVLCKSYVILAGTIRLDQVYPGACAAFLSLEHYSPTHLNWSERLHRAQQDHSASWSKHTAISPRDRVQGCELISTPTRTRSNRSHIRD